MDRGSWHLGLNIVANLWPGCPNTMLGPAPFTLALLSLIITGRRTRVHVWPRINFVRSKPPVRIQRSTYTAPKLTHHCPLWNDRQLMSVITLSALVILFSPLTEMRLTQNAFLFPRAEHTKLFVNKQVTFFTTPVGIKHKHHIFYRILEFRFINGI